MELNQKPLPEELQKLVSLQLDWKNQLGELHQETYKLQLAIGSLTQLIEIKTKEFYAKEEG